MPIRKLNYAYDVYGNVATQELNQGMAGNTLESFGYDSLHRLTSSTRTGSANTTVSYGYDAAGNFNFKSDFSSGGTAYNLSAGGMGGGGANAVKSVALRAGGTRSYGYDASGNMTSDNAGFAAIYDHANLATKMQRSGVVNYFTYGPSNAKARQTGTDGHKVYLGGFEDWISAGQTKVSLGNYAQVTNGSGGRVLHYFLTDRLGSVDAVTDGNGNLIETRGYDAFGAPRTGVWGDAAQIASTAITPKGFTSHEHLNSVQLIHMNGRMYDYQLGRFLGVDPFIQMPTNSQSLNPYSYIMNNPLSGTDPTGYSTCKAGKNGDGGNESCEQAPEPAEGKSSASEKIWKMVCASYCSNTVNYDSGAQGAVAETSNGSHGQRKETALTAPKATTSLKDSGTNDDSRGVKYDSSTREGREKIAKVAFGLRGELGVEYKASDKLDYQDHYVFHIRDKSDETGFVQEVTCKYRCDIEDYSAGDFEISHVRGEYDRLSDPNHGIVRLFRNATIPITGEFNVYQSGKVVKTTVALSNIENAIQAVGHESAHGMGHDLRNNPNGNHPAAEYYGLKAAMRYRELHNQLRGTGNKR